MTKKKTIKIPNNYKKKLKNFKKLNNNFKSKDKNQLINLQILA